MNTLYPRLVKKLEREWIGRKDGVSFYRYKVDNKVGECPSWDEATGSLLWIDVRRPALQMLNMASLELREWLLPSPVGAACHTCSREIVVALKSELRLFDPETGHSRHIATPESERPGNRLNEGKVSPCGQWFLFGSMDDSGEKKATGALYAMGRDGKIRRIHDGVHIANGFGFSPDGTRFYFSDSYLGVVYRAIWDAASGTISEVREWLRSDEEQGRPDGAMMASDGAYWSAGVSAGVINIFGADGLLHRTIPMPCHAPTMPCATSSGTVFVTSLIRPDWPDSFVAEHDGQLFELEIDGANSFVHPPAFNLLCDAAS